MKDTVKWLVRTFFYGVCWVFILSVPVGGESIYSHANEYLIKNHIVKAIDQELTSYWVKVSKSSRAAIKEFTGKTEKTI